VPETIGQDEVPAAINLQLTLVNSARNIPTIRIPERISWLFLRLFVRSVKHEDATQMRWRTRFPVMLAIAFIPAILQLALYRGFNFSLHNGPWSADFWNGVFGIVVFTGMFAPKYTWDKFIAVAPDIEKLLGSPSNCRSIQNWMERATSRRLQYGLAILGSVLAPAGLLIFHRQISTNVRVDVISYITLCIAGSLVMSGFYWVVKLTLLVRKIVRFNTLSLYWFDPSVSPGIGELGRLLGLLFALAMLGDSIISWSIFTASSGLGNGPPRMMMYVLLLLGTIALVFVGLAPQFWLSILIQKRRHETLLQLGSYVEAEPIAGSEEHLGQALDSLRLYSAVKDVSTPTINTENIFGYAISILAGFSPLIFQLFSHH